MPNVGTYKLGCENNSTAHSYRSAKEGENCENNFSLFQDYHDSGENFGNQNIIVGYWGFALDITGLTQNDGIKINGQQNFPFYRG